MLETEFYNEFFKKAFHKKTKVVFWNGMIKEYGTESVDDPIVIRLNAKIPISELLNHATLTLGEAYMNKVIEVDGDLETLIYDLYCQKESFMTNSKFHKWLPKENHSKESSRQDIKRHYDIGNDFYRLWLDKSLTYSCAYFKTPSSTLEQAQLDKIVHILEKLDLKEHETILDIGCGWGELILYAAKHYGAHATGITLSEEQYEVVKTKIKKEGLTEQVQVELLDYRDLGKRKFDHIVSVGMFEHVGKDGLAGYFQTVADHLKYKGTALIHGISGHRFDATGRDAWINKYIFPGGYIPRVSELITHTEKVGLQLIDLESLRRDYQLTLEYWFRNFEQVRETVLAEKGEAFCRMWELYLQSCAASFKSGNIDVIQYMLVHGNNNDLRFHRRY